MNLIDAMDDPELFKPWFKDAETWAAWRVFLRGVFGLPLDDSERATFLEITGRTTPPAAQVREAWLVVGRRGGKSFIAALIAVFLACFRDYRAHLQPGERATVALIAADRKQARTLMRYVTGLLEGVPLLRAMILSTTAEGIDLSNSVTIEVMTASFRSVRGYTIAAAICDEIAFWRSDESANPDEEILAALRPAQASIPGAMLICLSSPYRRSGALFKAYQQHYAQNDSPVLVAQAASRTMNPSLPQSVVDDEIARDPAHASAEYLAQFRTDIAGFLDEEWIQAALRSSGLDLPRVPGVRYSGFIDPSGGRVDAMTLAVGHQEGERKIVDLVRGVPGPFDPPSVVNDFAGILFSYGIHEVRSDRYGGDWPLAEFKKHDIHVKHSDKSKSELYLESLPAFAAGQVEIPAHKKLISELRQLERRTARGGRDSVDHPLNLHDDYANVTCGLIASLAKPRAEPGIRSLGGSGPGGVANDGRWTPVYLRSLSGRAN